MAGLGEAERAHLPADLAGLPCTDLACSLYVRGRKDPAVGTELDETLSRDDKIALCWRTWMPSWRRCSHNPPAAAR